MLATRTFLFCDLRDYTAFVERHGDAAARELIGDYRRIVRAEIANHEGAEIKTEGDSFYVVFPGSTAAVSAASAILREASLYSERRPERPMRIGIGIHAGEPQPHEGQYVGSAVIVAARLAQNAGAGELLVSDVVRSLLPRQAMPPMEERSGLALKGIEEAPRAFAVTWREATRPRPAASTEVAIEATPPEDRRILSPRVVGREAELATLRRALAEARAGRGQTVLVSGEAGVGKTALLRLLGEEARSSAAHWLVGECSEVEARRPFGPFVDALTAGGVPLPDALSQTGPGSLAGAEVDRYRVHEGFAFALAELAKIRPVVVATEDLHWADEATLELVPYLARKLRGARVTLVATYRSDELHRQHPLNHTLAELARGRLAEDVRLRPLDQDQTAALIQGALGLDRAPTPAFRQAIFDRCEGNPFFIEEVLRALVERGDIAYRDGAWRRTKDVAELAIPVSIRDAVQQRLRALSTGARRAMHVAAVIGQRFDFDLLRHVSGLADDELIAALRIAVDQQLVEEEPGDADEGYRFRHALTRESVLAELLQRERRLLHRAVGAALEARPRGLEADRVEQLAYHFDEAHDEQRALRYHRDAAHAAERTAAFARSAMHLERAIELAPEGDPDLGDLLLALADSTSYFGDARRGERAAEEAERLFAARADDRGRGAALRRLASLRWTLGEGGARDLAADAVRVLEPFGPSEELAAAYGEAARQAVIADDDRAVEQAERAVALAREAGASALESWSLITVGIAKRNRGDPDGWDAGRRALDLALERGLVAHAQRAYHNLLASIWHDGERVREFDPLDQAAMAHAARHGVEPEWVVNRRAFRAVDAGEWDRALRWIEQARDDTIWSAHREIVAAFIGIARAGPDAGLPLLEAPRRRLIAGAVPQWILAAAAHGAASHFIVGDWRAALAAAEPAAENLARRRPEPFAQEAVMIAIAAAAALGDEATEERWLALAASRDARAVYDRALRAYAAARRARRSGDDDGALRELAAATEALVELAPVSMFALPRTILRLERAEILAQAGRPDEAASAFAESAGFWRRAGATWYVARLEDWARERGIPVGAA